MLAEAGNIHSSRWRARVPNSQGLLRPYGSGGPLGLFLQGLARLGVDDVEQAAESLEGVEFALLLVSQGAGARFLGEFLHEGMIPLGKPDLEERAGGTGSEFSLKFNDPLPDGRAGVGIRCVGSHSKDCISVTALKEAFSAKLTTPLTGGLHRGGLVGLRNGTLYQPVSLQRKSSLGQSPGPSRAGADGARIVEQAVLYFLSRQAGELGVPLVIGPEKSLLAVQKGQVAAFEAMEWRQC
jgi:hypothetical protein